MKMKQISPVSFIHTFLKKYGFIYRSCRSVATLNFIVQKLFRYNNANFSIHYTSIVALPEKINFDETNRRSFMVSGHCYYQAANGIDIGEGTIWASGVKMISANHDKKDLRKWVKDEPIRIGSNCWIGANVVILPGIKLGNNVVVGAGAVITKSFPDNCVLVGNPASQVKPHVI